MKPRLLIAAAVMAVVGLIGAWATAFRRGADVEPFSILSVVFAPSEQFRAWGPDMALSPDGSTIAYVGQGDWRLRVRRIDQLDARPIDGTTGYGPFFSPDGRSIGYRNGDRLMRVSIDGGTPVELATGADFMGAADWGLDDFIVYAGATPDGSHGLYRVPVNGGPAQLVAALDGKVNDVYWLTPQSIEGGRVILCTLARVIATGARFQVVAVTAATGERRLLVDDARHGMYLGDGVLVYQRNNALFATRLDAGRLEVHGMHVPASDDMFTRVRLRSWAAGGGRLVYWPRQRAANRLVWIDRAGKQEPLALPPDLYHSPRLSPDGRSVVFSIGEGSEYGDLWRHDLSSGVTVKLTSNGRSATPLWLPDGSGIVFTSLGAVGRDLYRLSLDVGAEPIPIRVPAALMTEPSAWTDAGRTLLVAQIRLDSRPELVAVALDGSREPRVVRSDNARLPSARVSPDGEWMAYSARNNVHVARLPGGPPEWNVSRNGGSYPLWSRSGRELFFRRGNQLMVVPVTPGATFSSGTPQPLLQGRFYEAEPGSPNYDVALDDQRLLMVVQGSSEGPDRLNVIQGWKAEILRRLAASN
jgi:Tol biopolymer transport system component